MLKDHFKNSKKNKLPNIIEYCNYIKHKLAKFFKVNLVEILITNSNLNNCVNKTIFLKILSVLCDYLIICKSMIFRSSNGHKSIHLCHIR